MGDRAIIHFTDDDEIGPAIYLHWGGSKVKELLDRTQEVMKTRPNDVQYTTARAIAIACDMNPGNLSVGTWSTNSSAKEVMESTHGDAGVFLVDIRTDNWKIATKGGYGFSHE